MITKIESLNSLGRSVLQVIERNSHKSIRTELTDEPNNLRV